MFVHFPQLEVYNSKRKIGRTEEKILMQQGRHIAQTRRIIQLHYILKPKFSYNDHQHDCISNCSLETEMASIQIFKIHVHEKETKISGGSTYLLSTSQSQSNMNITKHSISYQSFENCFLHLQCVCTHNQASKLVIPSTTFYQRNIAE